jgi:SAM-dependent methyltransferase
MPRGDTPDAREYVHGYSDHEKERLADQADAVRHLLHDQTVYPRGSRILEPGCGVGAQTVTLARNNPDSRIVAVDLSPESLVEARGRVSSEGLDNVEFHVGDLFRLPFDEGSFDHVFICYVLEHLRDPSAALRTLRTLVKGDGTATVVEGDHGSCHFHPETEAALKVWRCLIAAQAHLGGDSLIGRRLYPLVSAAGYRDVEVTPRMVYVDHSSPGLVDGFIRKTIIAMVEGVEQQAYRLGLVDESEWREGIGDLYEVADGDDGTFVYTFYRAVGRA